VRSEVFRVASNATKRIDPASVGLACLWLAGVAAVVSVRGLWFDESVSARFASLPWPDMWKGVAELDPLFGEYYALLHIWTAAGSSVLWERLLSVVAGTATLPLVYKIAADIYDRRVAFVATAVLALSPPFLHEATEARPYAIMTLGFVATLYAWRAALRTDQSRWYALLALASLATIYAQAIAFIGIAALVSTLLVEGRRPWRMYARLAIVFAVVAAGSLPLLWIVDHANDPLSHWQQNPTSFHEAIKLLAQTMSGTMPLMLPLAALLVVGYVQSVRSNRATDARALLLLIFLPIVALALISCVRPLFIARYLCYISVPEAILAGRAIVAGYESRVWRVAALASLAWLLVVGVVQTRRLTGSGYDWRGVAAALSQNVGPRDGVAVEPSFEIVPLRSALEGNIPGNVVYPKHEALRTLFAASERLSPTSIARTAGSVGRIWLVTCGFSRDSANLQMIFASAYTPMQRRQFAPDCAITLFVHQRYAHASSARKSASSSTSEPRAALTRIASGASRPAPLHR